MKREWKVQRSVIERPDGHRRWDRAYQCLLQWAKEAACSQTQPTLLSSPQEDDHGRSHLCSRFDSAPTIRPDD